MVKIAAWPTAVGAYRMLLRNFGQFLHLSAGWLTGLIGCVVLKMLPWPDAISALLVIVTLLCLAAGSAAFSIGWCRVILTDETSYGAITFALSARDRRYLAYQCGIALIPATPFALLCWLFAADTWWASALSPLLGGPFHPLALLRVVALLTLLLPIAAASVAVVARLMIVLPAIAIDEPGHLLRQVWRHSAANGAPLFFGWLACVLPALVLWEALWLALDFALGPLAAPIVELVGYPLYFVALALTGGFFSYVYAQLVEGEPMPEENASPAGAVPA